MNDFINVQAWKIQHSGYLFYVCILNSDVLLKIAYASASERQRGAQRHLSKARCKKVGEYIDTDEGILANNIILNLEEGEFVPSGQADSSSGVLKIPDKEKSAWIVDGQHRIYGFEHATKKLDLVCSIFIGLELIDQARIFKKINDEQKGINPSIIYDLLPITKDAEFKKQRSQSLVKRLNEDPESAWHEQIKMLGVGKGLVSQAAFIRNLEKLIDPNGGILVIIESEDLQYQVLCNYFNAFRALFPKEWGSKKHVLTKAIGLSVMCGIFPKVYGLCDGNLKTENIIRNIQDLSHVDFSSETRGKSTNKLAIEAFTQEVLGELPDISITKEIEV
ncbi:MAG: DGQHR domain-containing protein [Acaryochloridaceae cyanobacterium RL_2_7]|nr:DGQHR domain-containing protein [Acaryochloridaceae cyanobacterium RL_2_7]